MTTATTAATIEANIDSVVTKGLAVVAIFHPGLSVGNYEPLVVVAALAAVVVEAGVRTFLRTHSLTQTLRAVEASVGGNTDAPGGTVQSFGPVALATAPVVTPSPTSPTSNPNTVPPTT